MKIRRNDIRLASFNIIVTAGCVAECGHCLLECEPKKLEYHFTRGKMLELVNEAQYAGMGAVMFSGGEPFVYETDLYMPLALSGRYMQSCIRTNGFWATSKKKTKEVLVTMKVAQLNSIGVSYDLFHAPFVPIQNIRNVLAVAEEIGLHCWLDWCGTDCLKEVYETLGSDTYYVLRDKTKFANQGLSMISRTGRARQLPSGYFANSSIEFLEYSCPRSFHCLTGDDPCNGLWVFPPNYVALCEQPNPRLFYKIPLGHWISRLQKIVDADPAVKALREEGIGGLIRKARKEKPSLLGDYYNDPCELCIELLGGLYPREDTYTVHYPEYLPKSNMGVDVESAMVRVG